MNQLSNYLSSLRGDVFKLLPMKEVELSGVNNHVGDYMESLIVNITGAMTTYPVLASQKQYLYAINNMQYLRNNAMDFSQWRKIVLSTTRSIDNLCALYARGTDDE